MDYQIAIPSYKRHNYLVTQTLKTLMDLEVDPDIITVFVANREEKLIYKTAIELTGYDVRVVAGVPGLLNQRIWYNTKYYDENTRILNLDDDIAGIYQKKGENKLEPYAGSLQDIVDQGFGTCEEYGARLWGINAALNGLFLKNTTTVGLRYVCGIFHGSYAGDSTLCGDDRVSESSGEDFETTLRNFDKYNKVVRLDGYAPKTKYFAQGGIQAELGGKSERDKDHHEALTRIAERYPEWAKTYKKSGDVTNIRLKTITEAKLPWETGVS
jgi:hypothetical protein